MAHTPSWRRPTTLLTCGLLLLWLGSGCNLIDTTLGRHASISAMVPGAGLMDDGQLECWLTLEFKRYPKDAELRNIEVRFESIALSTPASFDWAYIAQHDKLAHSMKLGTGYREAEMTTPSKPPPLGQPTRVRFMLEAKNVIKNAPQTLYLEAELYWDGIKQDTLRRPIEHIYWRAREGR